ncbi:bridging integrator 2a [Trichomycterus rosablanca]|uniref:bridging integrator 2a n=1 Tax=Trichomycterus rosablanca TaxID=2290929 RepID=UPI002F356DAD
MAERKSSINHSTQSKGGAGEFAKQVQRKFSRAQEKVLQKFGKSEETRDEQFEICAQNFQDQQSDGHRIYKDLKAYLNAVKVMRDASSRLFQSLFDAYALNWEGGEDLGSVVEGEDLLWSDYDTKLRDQAFLTMKSYMSQFPDMRERVAKRNRKLVDYDSTCHHLESLQNAKKKDDIKIGKAEEEMKTAKKIFEDMNSELKEELAVLFDSRVGCYVAVFQAISNLRGTFYKEMAQNNQSLETILTDLKAQHPGKSFVIKNFSRGTLTRRSLKDVLSPRSLRSSFSDFHMSYSPRGTLRREHTSSFRSNRSSYELHITENQASPSRPEPIKDTKDNHGVRDKDSSFASDDNSKVEESTTVTVIDTTEASESALNATKEDAKQDDQRVDTNEEEPVPTSEHDEEGDEPSPKASEDNAAHPKEIYEAGEMKNGTAANHKLEIEESETDCKE